MRTAAFAATGMLLVMACAGARADASADTLLAAAAADARHDYATELTLLRPLAEQGLAAAQYSLAFMYAYGRGVPKDDVEAARWCRIAAEQGYALAQYNLGFLYANGRGVPKDDVEAVRWYRKAAEQGYTWAQNNLGFTYENGRGVPKDDVEAVRWYRLAAEQGYALAQGNLGFMYANGRGVPKDDVEAVRWYRLAVGQGDAVAQTRLGFMYSNGRGVPKDDVDAAHWYRLAAEQGNAAAQYNLGLMYEYGHGVPKDDAEAVRWYRKAAEQGSALAQTRLGIMYANGRGVPKDPPDLTRTPPAKHDGMVFVLDRQGSRIFASGPITTDTPDQFDRFLANNSLADAGEQITIILQSPGGILEAGLTLGERIRQIKFKTAVGRPRIALGQQLIVEPGDCSSACAYTFLGGVKRYVGEQDRIGVHQFSSLEKGPADSPDNVQITLAKLVRYVTDMGADARMLAAASEVKPDDIHILRASEIKEWRVSTPSTPAPSPTPAVGEQPATKILQFRATQDLNLRTAPDPHSDKVLGLPPDDFIPKDTLVEVRYTDRHTDCRRHDAPGAVHTIWCPVVYRDHSGWANAFYLDTAGKRLSCSIDRTSFGCDQAAITSELQPGEQQPNDQKPAIKLCDELASASWDPDGPDTNKAVDFSKLNVSAAIPACEAAAKAFPNERRYWFQLGRSYDKNARNTEAAKVYAKAAAMGSGSAAVNLGILFEHGQGVPQDYRSAREWYGKAAGLGNPTGMFCYAATLDNGIGGPVDLYSAIKWYESAAQNGIKDATKVAEQLRATGLPTKTRCN